MTFEEAKSLCLKIDEGGNITYFYYTRTEIWFHENFLGAMGAIAPFDPNRAMPLEQMYDLAEFYFVSYEQIMMQKISTVCLVWQKNQL
jgi:hypothetical protein